MPERDRGLRDNGWASGLGAGRRDMRRLGATTVDITEPYWKVIREGSITEKEIADWLKGS